MLKAIAIYLGILVTSGLTWFDHIGQIFTKARILVGMMYRLFYSYRLTPTPCCVFIIHAYDLTWNMPASFGTLSQTQVCSHWKLRKDVLIKSVSSDGTCIVTVS